MVQKKSLTYKEQGDTSLSVQTDTAVSVRNAAKAIGFSNPDTIHGKAYLGPAVDHRIDDKAYRILQIITIASFDGPFLASYAELGIAAGCSWRTVLRKCEVLQSLGRIAIHRSINSRNRYSVLFPVRRANRNSADRCLKCSAQRPVDQMGICTPCLQQNATDKWAQRTLDRRGTMDWEVFLAIARADLTLRASRRQLHGAYIRAIDRKAIA